MIYNVRAVYDVLEYQTYNGNAYGTVVTDSGSDYITVGGNGTRVIFINTGGLRPVLDYSFLTDAGITAKLYKDVYLPYTHSAEITVGKGALATGEVKITLDGDAVINIDVTAEDSKETVAAAMASGIGTLTGYSASATENIVAVTYSGTSYVPLTVEIDAAETGVEADVEISAAGDLAEADVYNRDHSSAKTPSTKVYIDDGTIDFTNCINDGSAVREIMLLNKKNLDAERILAHDSIYAVLFTNAGGTAAAVAAQLIWHEI